MINWKVRFRNKTWVAGFVSQTVIVIQAIAAGLSGMGVIDLDLDQLDTWIKSGLIGINAILVYLSYLGIVIDPTVEGPGDSERALNREVPLKNK